MNGWIAESRHKMAAGTRVIHDSDISMFPANGTHYSVCFCFITFSFLHTKIPAAVVRRMIEDSKG